MHTGSFDNILHTETFINVRYITANMNVYVNDEVYEKVMSVEFKRKLFNVDRDEILEKIGFSDVIKKMYEVIEGEE